MNSLMTKQARHLVGQKLIEAQQYHSDHLELETQTEQEKKLGVLKKTGELSTH